MAFLNMIYKPLVWSGFRNVTASYSQESVAVIDKGDICQCEYEEASGQRVRTAAQRIMHIHSALLKQPHLRPCDVTNELLGSLVKHCIQIHDINTIRGVRTEASRSRTTIPPSKGSANVRVRTDP